MDISDYQIVKLIGRDASGKTYLATHPDSNKRVVIKLFTKSRLPSALRSFVTERFLDQGNRIDTLCHSHIAKVYELNHTNSSLYSITDYIEGENLKTLAGQICILDQIYIIKQIAKAIDYLAENGFSHFNIKPSNIILTSANSLPVLAGLGFAELMQLDCCGADQKQLLRPARHLIPEQLCHAPLSIRSDLYNLGSIFYMLLTNMSSVQVAQSLVASGKHIEAPTSQLPADMKIFQPFFDRAMALAPDDRFQTGQQLVAALDSINDEEIAYINNPQAMASSTQQDARTTAMKTPYRDNVIPLKPTHNPTHNPTTVPPQTSGSAQPETFCNEESASDTDVAIEINTPQASYPPPLRPARHRLTAILLLLILVLAAIGYFLMQQDVSYRMALFDQLDQFIKQVYELFKPS